ncbi:MAG: hypothetical protein P3T54_08375 [Dehalogenimonas sp.]|uniref:DUF1761 domain-containing protein n=1 Tax=Candidatus Dehalogenimonas loeffleri TaxID=3127115 RepID=A0ABZ2J1L3_9CHLR|nr:hypothetical protein [Dehalogenimonas sp.]
MIHIIDDYFLLAGAAVAVIWGIVAVYLTRSMVRRAAESGNSGLITSLWLARNLLVVFAGLLVFGIITTLGTENSVAQPFAMLAGMTIIVLVLLTAPRAYTIMPVAGKIGVLLELLAAILILVGSVI